MWELSCRFSDESASTEKATDCNVIVPCDIFAQERHKLNFSVLCNMEGKIQTELLLHTLRHLIIYM